MNLQRIRRASIGFVLLSGWFFQAGLHAQITFPQNGVRDERSGLHAFTGATIVVSPEQVLENATLLIRDGYITAVGSNLNIPPDAVQHDCEGQYLYPSFIDLFSSYGIPDKERLERSSQQEALTTARKGAWAWNEALLPEFDAVSAFSGDDKSAAAMRDVGFGAVLTHRRDGIARGSGAVVLLSGQGREHQAILRDRAASFYSFRKGSSTQNYPGSLMGAMALIRQTHLDGQWYAKQRAPLKEVNLSLEAWNRNLDLPPFFEAGDHYSSLRAAQLGREFERNYVLLGDGTEYRSLEEFKAAGNALVIPLNFPAPYDVSDPLSTWLISYPELLHWEMAPANAALLSEAGIPFALTASKLEKPGDFREALQKAMRYGLSESAALSALTTVPARLAGLSNELGSLESGKRANFLRCSGPIWEKESRILENWVGGKRFVRDHSELGDARGRYVFSAGGKVYRLEIGGKQHDPELKVFDKDSTDLKAKGKISGRQLMLNFGEGEQSYRLSGWWIDDKLSGRGQDHQGRWFNWSTAFSQADTTGNAAEKYARMTRDEQDSAKKAEAPVRIDPASIPRPFQAYGRLSQPQQETVLFRNANIWTNSDAGILEQADVLIQGGRIARVGSGLKAPDGARIVDATNKHITAGIIDEHSHIAISRGVNEGTKASSAEVRINDVINPADVNIYRQLAGGVVASQLLHGSANPVGGQSALIKLRWGASAEEMKIKGADAYIKFALGENVKQSNWGDSNRDRFPQTRMGVEQVYEDLFTRAREYGKRKAAGDQSLRPDLELEACLEILQAKRFITCHSYVQSEINMLMKVTERHGFRVNTFTHILEGYKLADVMKEHGAGASTFSDWWAYKYEVLDAIPYNAAILQRMGVVTALNSDDAEMGRRLNQEAAKTIKYGGLTHDEALRMVTLNPAKLLHLDKRMGSIEVGKDADIVVWSDHPLSIRSKAEQTWIDGKLYFSLEEDLKAREHLARERNRIVQLMAAEAAKGVTTREPEAEDQHLYHCDDIEDECAGF